MTDEQLSALLRLKRYEQPPQGYFDQLLRDIHRRQRSELLHKPLWRIALERMHTFFGEHSMGSLSYGGAMAALLVLGVAAIGLMTPGELQSGAGGQPQASASKQPANHAFSLQPAEAGVGTFAQTAQFGPSQGGNPLNRPRYVIDARPASYEPSFSF